MSYLAICPAGVILPYGGSTAPNGWLLCDGSAVSRDAYADAYAAIGVTYGVGNGSTTFNLPDMRGVFARGAGTNATSNYGGVTGHTPAGGTLGSKGGQKTAKNGLTGSSGTMSANTTHTHTGGSHVHTAVRASSGSRTSSEVAFALVVGSYSDGATTSDSIGTLTSPSVDHSHAVSIGAGDTETAPASLAVNYIIKI